jgi:hypothetical protein
LQRLLSNKPLAVRGGLQLHAISSPGTLFGAGVV